MLGLMKLCWSLDNKDDWATKFMTEKYISKRIEPLSFKKGSFIWKDIGKGWDLYKDSLRWNPGLGNNTNFWNDIWVGEKPLRSYVIGPLSRRDSSTNFDSLISNNKIPFSSLPESIPLEIRLIIKDKNFPSEPDTTFSSWTISGHFDSKKASSFINSSIRNIPPPNPKDQSVMDWNLVWQAPGHPKLKVFLWQVWWNRIP